MKGAAPCVFALLNSCSGAACQLWLSRDTAPAAPLAFNSASQASTSSEHVSKPVIGAKAKTGISEMTRINSRCVIWNPEIL